MFQLCLAPTLLVRLIVELVLVVLGLVIIRRRHRLAGFLVAGTGLLSASLTCMGPLGDVAFIYLVGSNGPGQPAPGSTEGVAVVFGWWAWGLCQPVGQAVVLALLATALVMLARTHDLEEPYED